MDEAIGEGESAGGVEGHAEPLRPIPGPELAVQPGIAGPVSEPVGAMTISSPRAVRIILSSGLAGKASRTPAGKSAGRIGWAT